MSKTITEKESAIWINALSAWCREANDTWWRDPATDEPLATRNKGELIALMHSELFRVLRGG